MDKAVAEILGYIAAFLSGIAFVPQVYKIYKKPHNTKELSLFTTLLYLAGMTLWVVYGIALSEYPIVLSCGFSGICNLYLLIKILTHPRN